MVARKVTAKEMRLTAKIRWAKLTPKDRVRATAAATAAASVARLKAPKKTSRLARKNAKSISPEAASARAKKAWATKRARAAEDAAG